MTGTKVGVIVVGAGPTGLMLASELALAGVRTVVVDKLAVRSGQSKALGVQPRSAEVLDLRGALEPLLERAVDRIPGGHFAGLPLDYSAWNTRYPYGIGIPQPRVEAILEERLAGQGIHVLRDHQLTCLSQDLSDVTATVAGPSGDTRLRGRYLVGCDGGRSTVRKLLRAGFPGRDGRLSSLVADITLADPSGTVPATWSLPVMTPRRTGTGQLVAHGDGVYRFLCYDADQQAHALDAPIREDEITRALLNSHGSAVRLTGIRWASRFTDASRQAEQYRHGRVLLAGDAAHIHSPLGGQGLNLGLQDAFNLGWKLAAEINGWAPEGLVDSYHAERHPVGARVLANTRAQGLLLTPDEDGLAMRSIVSELLKLPEANRRIAGMISGLDVCYDLPGDPHPLLGRQVPDLDLRTAGRAERLAWLLREGRVLLLSIANGPTFAEIVRPWSPRVRHVIAGTAGELGAEAVLIRPDGYVCWAGSADGSESLVAALTRWAGRPIAKR